MNVDLQEYIESKVLELERRTDIKMAAHEKALELKAKEYDIHFVTLNHKQAEMTEDRARYLPRETYAADRKDKMAATLSVVSIVLSILFFTISRLLDS